MPLTNSQLKLVTQACECLGHPACHWQGTPTLIRHPTGGLGAYCPQCSHWIKWVVQNAPWLELERLQKEEASPVPVEPFNHQFYRANNMLLRDMLVTVGRECWDISEAHGWHTSPRSTLERAMLTVTELAELSESARHGALNDPSDHIPEHTQAAEEWADVLVRVFDHCVEDGVTHEQLAAAFFAKVEFNRSRPYRHGGKTI